MYVGAGMKTCCSATLLCSHQRRFQELGILGTQASQALNQSVPHRCFLYCGRQQQQVLGFFPYFRNLLRHVRHDALLRFPPWQ
jgi:hypothetical protein